MPRALLVPGEKTEPEERADKNDQKRRRYLWREGQSVIIEKIGVEPQRERTGGPMAAKTLYTVIVADDEDELREAVCTMIPWQDYGFCLVGDASNGLDAL